MSIKLTRMYLKKCVFLFGNIIALCAQCLHAWSYFVELTTNESWNSNVHPAFFWGGGSIVFWLYLKWAMESIGPTALDGCCSKSMVRRHNLPHGIEPFIVGSRVKKYGSQCF